MGDDDNLGIGEDDVGGMERTKQKGGGSGFLPTLLKFVAIGLGALIFIVTIAVITFRIMSSRGESQTQLDPTSEYIGTRQLYNTFTLIGQVTTRTRDQNHTVVVDMLIEYDLNNNAAQTELTGRVNQLRDFTRRFFASKYYGELEPENEERLKREIREVLNNQYLDTAKVRGILFNRLDVMEL
jgi:flagellar FliL protein